MIIKISYGKLRRVQVCYHLLALDKQLAANSSRGNGQTAEIGKIDHEKK
jgi:hypothetical protein